MSTVVKVRSGPATHPATDGQAPPPRRPEDHEPPPAWGRSALADLDLPEIDYPNDVVDRLLWRNAQRIMSRHAVRLDGRCRWCDQVAPCEARRLAVRAAEVARLPWRQAWHIRNEITGRLPVLAAQRRRSGPSAGRDAPASGRTTPASGAPERPSPTAGDRRRTWIRVIVRRAAAPT